jgi:glycosyltransferase involved in cell wall biosynthesis
MKGIKGWLWNSLVYRRGLAYSINNADAIIVNSSQTMKEVLGKGGKKNKIFIINLGLDGRFTKRKQKKQQENKFTVGYIGSFAQNKNVKFLLNAANEYHNTHHGYDPIFSIWGNKSFEYNNLLKIARGNKNIVFNGFAPESRLVQIYDSFDVFVFPSYYEGFGLPILEAQARDLPVIIYKKAKIPVEVRKYCFEAESQEHMAQIIEDLKENGYNEKLQMKATKYARSFTWEKTAKETLEVYKKLI